MSSGSDPKPPKKPRTKTDPKPRRKSAPAMQKPRRRTNPKLPAVAEPAIPDGVPVVEATEPETTTALSLKELEDSSVQDPAESDAPVQDESAAATATDLDEPVAGAAGAWRISAADVAPPAATRPAPDVALPAADRGADQTPPAAEPTAGPSTRAPASPTDLARRSRPTVSSTGNIAGPERSATTDADLAQRVKAASDARSASASGSIDVAAVRSASASGSIDVAVSAPELPRSAPSEEARAEEAAQRLGESNKLTAEQANEIVARAGASGSVEVSLSSSGIPHAANTSDSQGSAIPEAVGASDSQPMPLDSQPVSASGAVAVATPTEGSGPVRGGRAQRVTGAIQGAISGGVERIGTGIGVVGAGVGILGDVTKRVPVVGAGVGMLGEGIAKAGESIHALPRVAQTRRGRLLVRSVVVGFAIVFAWIAVIVGFQLRAHDTPDFRPEAERILVQMGKGPASIAQVYEHASPRFQELVKKERFIDDMTDLYATNGKFREISAINETLVTHGPAGRIGRVGLTASFERGISRGSISFHWESGAWKLLGIGLEVPNNVAITQTERQKRVAACIDDKGEDVSDQRRKCDVRDAAESILELIREGRSGEVWDEANDVFKQQESRPRFIQIQEEQRQALGNWKRILDVTDARAIGGMSATFDVVCEFESSSGVRVEFDFTRPSKFERWKLARFKVTVPLPRASEMPTGDGSATPRIDVPASHPL